MDATEKRQLETQLVRMGLAGLQENGEPTGELIQQIAAIVNNWQAAPNRHGEWVDKHMFLRDLLAECDAANRSDMYSAIVPHLSFKAKPLSHYETMMTARMSSLVSKGAARIEGRAPHPIEVAGGRYIAAPPDVATHAIATLLCWKCGKQKRFLADTPAGAMIAARKAGWVLDPAIRKETCKICAKRMVN